jgi:hypothetical protein
MNSLIVLPATTKSRLGKGAHCLHSLAFQSFIIIGFGSANADAHPIGGMGAELDVVPSVALGEGLVNAVRSGEWIEYYFGYLFGDRQVDKADARGRIKFSPLLPFHRVTP